MPNMTKEKKEKIYKALADAGMGDILLQQLLDSITQKGSVDWISWRPMRFGARI